MEERRERLNHMKEATEENVFFSHAEGLEYLFFVFEKQTRDT